MLDDLALYKRALSIMAEDFEAYYDSSTSKKEYIKDVLERARESFKRKPKIKLPPVIPMESCASSFPFSIPDGRIG